MVLFWNSPTSLRRAGFKWSGIDDSWLIVGQWDTGVTRDELLGKIQIRQLRGAFGARRVGEFHYLGYMDYSHIIVVEPADDILSFVDQQGLDWESGGVLDDVDYYNMLGPLIDEYWATLPIAERLELIVRTDAEPAALYSVTPDDAFYSELIAAVEAR